ncbi:MAG: Uncharacterised protein [Prochlorococcus marinus str. MIT 9215]|nr:MAG: Uncharacterised protein [Prochlorococcus marinus str. MIT 9215]
MSPSNIYTAAAYKLFKYLDRLRPAGSLGLGNSIINDCKLLFNAYRFKPSNIIDVGANDGRTYQNFRAAF